MNTRPVLLLMAISLTVHVACSQTKVISRTFDGRTPCRELATQLNEKLSSDCIKIKWRLVLFSDSLTGKPAGYEIIGFAYQRNNPRKGDWRILKGTSTDPDAVVIELKGTDKPDILLQQVDDDVLFFLDRNRNLMVGNYDFSFTLNKK